MKEVFKIIITLSLILLPLGTHAQIIIAPCPPGFTGIPPNCIPNPTSEPNPIVIVPGMLTSFNFEITALDQGVGEGEWNFFPFAESIYRGLIERLENADLDVTVAHYDWRKPVSETSLDYLKPAIEEVKSRTGANKVDIVSHSMGGLVAREYIQGPQYSNDIDQLITIGTPHKGASDAYIAHEGGDIPTRWGAGTKSYMRTVENALKVANGTFPFPRRPESFRTFFPSLKDLLPTQPFIERNDDLLSISDINTQNLYLSNRNETLDQDLDTTNVELTTIAGTGLNTLDKIIVDNEEERSFLDSLFDRWRDGPPNPNPPSNNGQGDQTALLTSARLDSTTPIDDIEHDKLPEAAQEQVLDILDRVAVTGTHIAYELPDSALSTLVLSPIDPAITCGDETLDENTNTFPNAQFISGGEPGSPKLLVIKDPPSGTCELKLTGNDSGDYHVITTYADDDEVISFTQQGTTNTNQVSTSNIVINDDSFLTPSTNLLALIYELEQSIKSLKKDHHIDKKSSHKLLKRTKHLISRGKKYQKEVDKHDSAHKHVGKSFKKLQKGLSRFEKELSKQIKKQKLGNNAILEITNILDQLHAAGL